jgi:enamine deaminase RidA (YjgF/YER057c/UK114 family)
VVRRVNPKSLGPAVGYSHGVRAGNTLHIAGQVGGTPKGDGGWSMKEGFAAQFEKALENIVEVVRAEGGTPNDIVEMVILVKDVGQYKRARNQLAAAWRRTMGQEYPAITLVGVNDLYEQGALLEIRAVAHLEG